MKNSPYIEKFELKPYNEGSLSNLSFSVKDCIDVKGHISGFGNPTWKNTHYEAVANAVCVEQLLLNGARCLGKTITDEFTYSLIGENQFYGTPINPMLPERVPGGSSSGSASSVALGDVGFSIGTDTGGSVRVPAANCGLFGYRPTHGLIAGAGVIPLAPSLDTVGVIARDFYVLNKVAHIFISDPCDDNYIGKILIPNDLIQLCTAEIITTFYTFLKQHNIQYTTINLHEYLEINTTLSKHIKWLYSTIHSIELWSTHGAWIEHTKPEMGKIAQYNFENIAKITDRRLLLEALAYRDKLKLVMNKLLLNNNILAFPTVPDLPPLRGEYLLSPENRTKSDYSEKLIAINAIASLSRTPQITIPVATDNGYSIGVSFLANHGKDSDLLKFVSNLYSD